MSQHIEAPPDNAIPPISEGWQLTDDIFMRWWGLLDEQDRREFTDLNRGDKILARFVCVLDYLLIQKVQAPESSIFQLAYSIAANMPMESPNLRAQAARAWKHDAVQTLVERVRFRSLRQRSVKVENNHLRMLEQLQESIAKRFEKTDELTTDDVKDITATLSVVNKYLSQVSNEESARRNDRSARALAKARESLKSGDNDMSTREFVALFKAHVKDIPDKDLIALLPAKVKEQLAGSQ